MAVYWQGIVDAYHVIPSAQTNNTKNPGLTFATQYSAIVEPQPQVSTLLEEFPLLNPSYVEEQGPNHISHIIRRLRLRQECPIHELHL